MPDPQSYVTDSTGGPPRQSDESIEPAFSAADVPVWDEGWRPTIRYEVLERWLELAKVRQVGVRDKVTGQFISMTVF